MVELKYAAEMPLPEKAYKSVSNFLMIRTTKMESSWKGLTYKGQIFYLDSSNQKAVRISKKRLFRKRKIELSDKVEQEIIDKINNIINTKEVGENNNDR